MKTTPKNIAMLMAALGGRGFAAVRFDSGAPMPEFVKLCEVQERASDVKLEDFETIVQAAEAWMDEKPLVAELTEQLRDLDELMELTQVQKLQPALDIIEGAGISREQLLSAMTTGVVLGNDRILAALNDLARTAPIVVAQQLLHDQLTCELGRMFDERVDALICEKLGLDPEHVEIVRSERCQVHNCVHIIWHAK
jgi:hypothetical protein